jgi:hypothetical protein
MCGASGRVVAAVVVSIAVSVAVSSLAQANGGPSPPTRLDKGTASVLADDIAFSSVGESFDPFIQRCIRVGALRVDCVFEFAFNGQRLARVVAVLVVGERVLTGLYDIELRGYYSNANSIQKSPADPAFRRELIQEWYDDPTGEAGEVYDPEFLVTYNVGWGRPQLPGLIRRQCALQPRLFCDP